MTNEKCFATTKKCFVINKKCLATTKESFATLTRPNAKKLYLQHNTEKHLLHSKKTYCTVQHFLYQTTPNYTKLRDTIPKCTYYNYYTKLHRTVPTTSNFTHYTTQRLITSTTRNHTKLHLLNQHSPTTLTTPNYTYYTSIH